jgi:hypothetical protein
LKWAETYDKASAWALVYKKPVAYMALAMMFLAEVRIPVKASCSAASAFHSASFSTLAASISMILASSNF